MQLLHIYIFLALGCAAGRWRWILIADPTRPAFDIRTSTPPLSDFPSQKFHSKRIFREGSFESRGLPGPTRIHSSAGPKLAIELILPAHSCVRSGSGTDMASWRWLRPRVLEPHLVDLDLL